MAVCFALWSALFCFLPGFGPGENPAIEVDAGLSLTGPELLRVGRAVADSVQSAIAASSLVQDRSGDGDRLAGPVVVGHYVAGANPNRAVAGGARQTPVWYGRRATPDTTESSGAGASSDSSKSTPRLTAPDSTDATLVQLPADSLSDSTTVQNTIVLPDSAQTEVAPDSALAGGPQARPIDLRTILPVDAPLDSLPPASRPFFELQDQLRDVPGGFVYNLGSYGWPHGWSPHGVDPQQIGLIWNGMSMNDLFTGRAQYEFIPISLSEPLSVSAARQGRPVSVVSATRSLDVPEPLTEVRFQTDSRGLQKVTGFHVQNRPLRLFGVGGIMNIAMLYRGEGATGDYPDSRLRRGRQLYGRVRYRQPRWVLELAHLFNRQRVGAQGGVIPPDPSDPNSIYLRKVADVTNPDSERKAERNDLSAVLAYDWRAGPLDPFTVRFHWGDERFQYRRPGDTLGVSVRRFGLHARQPVSLGSHELFATVEGWSDRARTDFSGLPDTVVTREQLFVSLTALLRLGRLRLEGTAGADASGSNVRPMLHIRADLELGILSAFVGLTESRQPQSILMETGLGRFVGRLTNRSSGTLRHAKAGLGLSWWSMDLGATLFAERASHWSDLFETADQDSAVFVATSSAVTRTGATIDFGIRRLARKGIYLVVRPSWTRVLDDGGTTSGARLEGTVPRFHGTARLGMRYVIFRGDFDFDLSARARAWEAMRSRRLNTASGLLVVPVDGSSGVDGSVALDLALEVGIRTAHVFLIWENILTGTTYLPGNMIVPVYPLSQQRLRFGIHWPIRN